MKKLACLLFLVLSVYADPGELSHIITPRGGKDPQSDNKDLIETFYGNFEANNIHAVSELLAPKYDVQDSTATFDSPYSKHDAFSKDLSIRIRSLHEALPDFKLTIIEMLADGNKVFARTQIQGIQRGSFLGVEPTNKPVVIKAFVLFTIEEGKIIHINELWNELGVMKQIGYIAL